VPIKGLRGKPMPLDAYIDADSENVRVPKNDNAGTDFGKRICKQGGVLKGSDASQSL
jgi:hypothetical protein